MMNDPKKYSLAFHQSVALLLQLHHEMSTGDPDGDRADAVRDEMERPWYEMSDCERELIRGLSADLYTIGQPRAVGETIRDDLLKSVLDALKDARCEELLNTLRLNERALPPDSVAFLRGMAWSLFGQYDAAIEFFQEATRLSGSSWPPFIHGLLTALIAAGRTEQAVDTVQRVAAESDNPLIVLDAAEVYFVRSTEVEHEQSELILQKAVETADRGLKLAEQVQQNDALRYQRAQIQLWLALFHISVGDLDAAGRAAEIADNLAQDNPNVVFLKEIIAQRSARQSWDKGIGKVMVRLRGLPTSVSTLPVDLITSL